MTDHIDTLRATMTAFGYRADRIDAALSALSFNSCTAPQQAEEPYLSPKKLCRCLDISGTTLWRHNPPCHRIGGRKRYRLDEVVAHMARTVKTGPGNPHNLKGNSTALSADITGTKIQSSKDA